MGSVLRLLATTNGFLSSRRNLLDALSTFTVRVLAAFLAFGVQVFLARTLDLGDYGIYVTLWTWLIIVNHLGVLGFSESAIRFIPRYVQQGRIQWAKGFLHAGYKCVLVGAIAMSGIAYLMLPLWEQWIPQAYHLPIMVLILGLPFTCLELYLEGVSRSFGWYLLTTIPGYIIRPLVLAGGVMVYYAMGHQPDAATVLTFAVGVTAMITIVQATIIRARLQKMFGDVKAAPIKKIWLLASLPLVLTLGVDEILHWSDILILGFLVSAEEVSIYFAAQRAMSLAAFVQYAFMLVSVRDFSLANATRDHVQLQATITNATRWTFWLTVPAVLITLVFGYPLLYIFGPSFVAGYPIMLVLGIGFVIRASVGQARDLMIVLGHQKASVYIAVFGIMLNIILSVLMVPVFGILGAAIATSITMAFQAVSLTIAAKKLANLWVVTDIPDFQNLGGQIRTAIATNK